MAMVDLLGYPYPHPRHVRRPDAYRLADWLQEIGVTTPARRTTDTQPAAPNHQEKP